MGEGIGILFLLYFLIVLSVILTGAFSIATYIISVVQKRKGWVHFCVTMPIILYAIMFFVITFNSKNIILNLQNEKNLTAMLFFIPTYYAIGVFLTFLVTMKSNKVYTMQYFVILAINVALLTLYWSNRYLKLIFIITLIVLVIIIGISYIRYGIYKLIHKK